MTTITTSMTEQKKIDFKNSHTKKSNNNKMTMPQGLAMNTTLTSMEQIYKGGRGAEITLDLHCWVECGEVVLDYTDDQLKEVSLFGTKNIVRKPFEKKLAAECLMYIMEVVGAKMKLATDLNMAFESFTLWHEETGNCCCRAMTIYRALKDKGYKPMLKIGSLGFVQKNGKDIFYEYG